MTMNKSKNCARFANPKRELEKFKSATYANVVSY